MQIYFKNLLKLQLLAISLPFIFFLFEKFSLLAPDPDPGGKTNADPCGSGSGSTALAHLFTAGENKHI